MAITPNIITLIAFLKGFWETKSGFGSGAGGSSLLLSSSDILFHEGTTGHVCCWLRRGKDSDLYFLLGGTLD